jgi:serine/threonine protein phosphatase PrpC
MMKIQVFSQKSPNKRECEDAYFVRSSGCYGVMDGVTPIHDFKDEHGHNPAFLASNHFKAFFEQSLGLGSLSQMIIEANRQLKNKMLEYHMDLSVKHELWSTCIAAAHVSNGEVSYAQLGDSMVLVRDMDGTILVLTENLVSGLSVRAKAKRERGRRKGLSVPEERFYEENPYHLHAYLRSLANGPEGYGVANGMDEVKDYIQYGTVQTSDLTHMLLITDGMFYPGKSLEDAFQMILDLGFERYIDQVERAELAKGLRPDDRTGILLEFEVK